MQRIQMPTVLQQRANAGQFRIIPHVPLYCFSSYGQRWYRILMLEDGYYLRMPLTPVNGEWAEMLGNQLNLIQWGTSSWSVWNSGKDRYTHTLPQEVVTQMRDHLGSHAERLLTGDIWADIEPMWPTSYNSPHDVRDWLGRCGYNDGIVLSRVQKNPGTWKEIHEAHESRLREEREARISAVLGSLAPLSEAERELGLSLEGHDWSYEYSDDGSVCRRGREHREELTRALKALPGERARAIWAAYAPEYSQQYWKCPV